MEKGCEEDVGDHCEWISDGPRYWGKSFLPLVMLCSPRTRSASQSGHLTTQGGSCPSRWEKGRARPGLTGLCKVPLYLDLCCSVFQMQTVHPEAHGKDRCSGPLCFWYVSRALPQPGEGKSEGSDTDYVTLGKTVTL